MLPLAILNGHPHPLRSPLCVSPLSACICLISPAVWQAIETTIGYGLHTRAVRDFNRRVLGTCETWDKNGRSLLLGLTPAEISAVRASRAANRRRVG